MKIHCYEVGRLRSNAYLLENEQTKEGILIDCGGEGERLASLIIQEGIDLKAILLTHGHADHLEGVEGLLKGISCPLYIHEEDFPYLLNPAWNHSPDIYGKNICLDIGAEKLADGEKLDLAGFSIEVFHTPGHTLGSACFKVEDCLFTGDTLFRDTIGGDFPPHGDTDIEIYSIRKQLFTIEENLICYPGHGEPTTLDYERKNNMYCRI